MSDAAALMRKMGEMRSAISSRFMVKYMGYKTAAKVRKKHESTKFTREFFMLLLSDILIEDGLFLEYAIVVVSSCIGCCLKE